jgi:hypothetical protein
MTRSRWTVLALATLLPCAALQGDQPKKPETAASPLPRYYRKLGLNQGQAEKVRKTWTKYREKIEGLRKQIQGLQKEAAVELEKSLTDAQKARLKELRALGPGEFKLDAPRRPFPVSRGQTTTFAVELKPDAAFEGSVRLTFEEVPAGVTIDPRRFEFKEGGNPVVEFKIAADKNAPIGEFAFTIRATPDDGEPVEVKIKILVKF